MPSNHVRITKKSRLTLDAIELDVLHALQIILLAFISNIKGVNVVKIRFSRVT